MSGVSDDRQRRHRDQGLTWIPRLAVGALVVPGDILDEILQGLFVASLLALAEGTGHVHGRGREANCNRQCGGGLLRRWSLCSRWRHEQLVRDGMG